jgi:hypothetical protein
MYTDVSADAAIYAPLGFDLTDHLVGIARFAGPSIDPKYARRETDDIIAAIRKVYPTIGRERCQRPHAPRHLPSTAVPR